MARPPSAVQALLLEATRCHEGGDRSRAEQLYREVLAAAPHQWEALYRLGQLAHDAGRSDAAIELFERALRHQRQSAELYWSFGYVLNALKKYTEAARQFRRALVLKPDLAPAHALLGDVLERLGLQEEAAESLARAARLTPGAAPVRVVLGMVLRNLHRPKESAAVLHEAVGLDPQLAAAHLHLGITQRSLGAWEDALASHQRAVELDPGEAGCHINYAWTLLLTGAFERAWPEYEWRVKAYEGRDYLAHPRIPGRILPRPSSLLPFDPAGKRLLLMREQGLGDQLFFLRYAARARARGARLACLPGRKIATLLARVPALEELAGEDAVPEDYEQMFLVGDLPLLTGAVRAQDIPPPLELAVLPETRAAARSRLGLAGAPPYLAVTWRAGIAGVLKWDATLSKEIGLARLGNALVGWPGTVIVIQRDPAPGEIERFSCALGHAAHDFSDLNASLEDMLGLLAEVHEYVGVSNTNMHLAAGTGRTCRVLVPNPPDYRWMARGNTSPWFPGFSVYRQTPDGSWDEALARLSADLRCAGGG